MPRMGTGRNVLVPLITMLLFGSMMGPSAKSAQGATGGSVTADQNSRPATSPTQPTVVSGAASSITQTAATLHGTVDPNGAEVSKCEFEYGTTISYGKIAACAALPGSGESPVAVSAPVTGLSANTTYHYRVVATNSAGSNQAPDETFKTPPNPAVVTKPASSIGQTAATLNATVNPNGAEVSKCEFEYGTTISYGETVNCAALPGSGESPVAVSAAVTVLSLDTTYHYRIVAVGSDGRSVGIDETFKTLPAPPTVVSKAASSITQTMATLNGTVDPNGAEVSKCEFEYGTTVAYGKTANCSALPGSGESPVTVSAAITGLAANTTYHFRIVATNSGGSTQALDETFKTLPNPPTVVSEAASSVSETSAVLHGSVNPNGGAVSKCEFEYGTTLAYGKIATCVPSPGSGQAAVAVTVSLPGLSVNTSYHYRIVAVSPGGTSFGVDETLKTLPAPPAVVSEPASSVTGISAVLNGSVNPNGEAVGECRFDYGATAAYGASVACSSLPGSGEAAVAVSALLKGLSVNTTYHYRIVAVSPGGTSSGLDGTFKTPPAPPNVISEPASSTTKAPAILGVLSFHVQKPPVQSLKLVSSSLTASGSGVIRVKVSCPAGQGYCRGTMTVRTLNAIAVGRKGKATILTLARGSFDLVGRRKGTLKLRLSARAQTLISHAHVLRASATVVTQTATGATQSQTVVTLR